MKQIYAAHVSAQSSFALPDLAGALKQIQNQYDDIAAKNLQVQNCFHPKRWEQTLVSNPLAFLVHLGLKNCF